MLAIGTERNSSVILPGGYSPGIARPKVINVHGGLFLPVTTGAKSDGLAVIGPPGAKTTIQVDYFLFFARIEVNYPDTTRAFVNKRRWENERPCPEGCRMTAWVPVDRSI
ncbi:hypothetical protein MTBGP_11100 [Moorella thermoacetica]